MTFFDTHFHYSGEIPIADYRAQMESA